LVLGPVIYPLWKPIAPTNDAHTRAEVGSLKEALFSLNIAGAAVLGALTYILKNVSLEKPLNDSTYLSLRNMYRVIDFLAPQSQNPVATSAVRRQPPSSSEQLGTEVFVIVTWLGTAAAVALLLWSLRHTRIYGKILASADIAILLFSLPACYLFVGLLTWDWVYEPGVTNFFMQKLTFTAIVVEVLGLGVVLPFRTKSIPQSIAFLLASLHCTFWISVLWSETRVWLFPLYARDLILGVFLFSVLVSVYRRERKDVATNSRKGDWLVACIPLGIAGIVWSPAKNIELSNSRNLDSAMIELSRGPCFGSCPTYTVTVYGSGQVRYVGQNRHEQGQTKKSGTLPQEKFIEILHVLDRVRFMTLESRAFVWAFDTPTVGLRASVDGKEKLVASDSTFVGPQTGRQARFEL
jgi:hypothetical protein